MKLMKLTIFMFALAFVAGCSKTSSPAPEGSNNGTGGGGGGGNTTPTYFFTCKVNGVATTFAAMTLIKDNPADPQQIFLVGAKSNTELPQLTFTLNKTSAGWVDGLTYVMDEKDLTNLAEYQSPTKLLFKSTATPASASSGLTLHFDKIVLPKDQYASGTFSGTLQLEENITSVAITEGKFKVQFMN